MAKSFLSTVYSLQSEVSVFSLQSEVPSVFRIHSLPGQSGLETFLGVYVSVVVHPHWSLGPRVCYFAWVCNTTPPFFPLITDYGTWTCASSWCDGRRVLC